MPSPSGPQHEGDYRLPSTAGSVVWFSGHPFVLDGEGSIPTTGWWVGLDDSGDPDVIPSSEMAKHCPAILWEAPGDA